MKNRLLLLLFLLSYSCKDRVKVEKPAGAFTLKGTITGKHGPVIWLRYPDSNGKIIQQKAAIKNDTFLFKGSLSSPVNAEFSNDFEIGITCLKNYCTSFLSPGNMTVSVDCNSIIVNKLTGSFMQDEWDGLNRQKNYLVKLIDSLYHETNKISSGGNTPKNHAMVEFIGKKIDSARNKEKQIDYSFITTHPNSYLSPYLTEDYFSARHLQLDTAEKFYNSLYPTIKSSIAGKSLQRNIASRKISAVGSIAPLFTKKDINGNQIPLKSYRDKKYIILYFGSSLCVSQEDIRCLKKQYTNYSSKGLDIIGISSFDEFILNSKDTIKKYGMSPWHNIQIKYNDKLQATYDIQGMPPFIFFLIDTKGKIIGRYIGNHAPWVDNGNNEGTMEDLDKKLKETFGY